MWDQVKDAAVLIFGSQVVVKGKGRTFAKVPMWLGILMALASLRLTIITALLVVAFGMQFTVVKA